MLNLAIKLKRLIFTIFLLFASNTDRYILSRYVRMHKSLDGKWYYYDIELGVWMPKVALPYFAVELLEKHPPKMSLHMAGDPFASIYQTLGYGATPHLYYQEPETYFAPTAHTDPNFDLRIKGTADE